MSEDYLQRILKARVYDAAIESPLDAAPRLSQRLGNQVLLKREDLQPVFSFKLRGAYTRIANLSESAAQRGVVCASAGNHAQGVALAARRRQLPAVIVMPQTTPHIKVQAVLDLGGEGLLHGYDYDSALERALELARERSLVFVHAFDDPDVIAGQGTVAVEVLRQTGGRLDAIFVPVGGGGLLAGIAVYVKYLYPAVRIIGVEPRDAAGMYESLKAGRRVTLERVGMFADGVAVRRVGEETFGLCRGHVDEILLLDTDEICAAIQDVFEDTRSIVEPAGALAVAGLSQYVAREVWRGKRLVAINSGANMNFDRLLHVAERVDLGGQLQALLAVVIPEQPGSFLHFCEVLYRFEFPERPGALLKFLQAIGVRWNITLFHYRNHGSDYGRVLAGIQVPPAERADFLRHLNELHYGYVEETANPAYRMFLSA